MTGTATGTTTYTVVYFDYRAKAELTKFLLEKGGATWNDEHPEWPSAKSQTPFGQLPVLIEKVDSVEVFRVAQSHAIERYLANKFDLAGSTPHETALLDSIFESYVEIRSKLGQAIISFEDEGQTTKLESFFEKILPEWLSYHETLLSKSFNNGNVKGLYTSKLSYVEIYAFTWLERMVWKYEEEFGKATNGWESAPYLKAMFELVQKDERIAAYIKSPARKPMI
ncbi:hypothetical protein HDU76_005109 [Blyttiomyces sp. JEL0837]|nr:hypothetical protein HDU76_005109 [Blyttiomyces sp. JEL0837]